MTSVPNRSSLLSRPHGGSFSNLVCVLLSTLFGGAPAQAIAAEARNFADLSIEELMDHSITSVSKKETMLRLSPAAVAVITREDVGRLGITTLPEALRLLPGMSVGRINANKWAVSARGFNGQFANKLLVLVDGRAVYTPTFAGVYWDVQDIVMEDMDRIEVIRGPGATLWGSNAVNGVINITSKSAKETQGVLISASVGTEDRPSVTARYGGKLAPNVFYRAFVKYFDREGFVDAAGRDTPDDWDLFRSGFRIDGQPSPENAFTLLGNYHLGHSGEFKRRASLTPPFAETFNSHGLNRGANLLGRWSREPGPSSRLTLQAYYDHFDQNVGQDLNQETRDTFDLDLQHRFPWGARQDIVWGAGYRHTMDKLPSNFGVMWTPERQNNDLFNVFVQDELTLAPDRWHLILGTKVEHHDYTGFEVQPNARVLWTPNSQQTVWAAASRATRTPSRFERTARLNVAAFRASPASPPFLVSLFGDPKVESEKLTAYELGYRIEVGRDLAFDVAAFYNVYDRLTVFVAGPNRFEATPAPAHVLLSPLTMQNAGDAQTHGVELAAQWRPSAWWKLSAAYSLLRMSASPAGDLEGDSPEHQVHLRSYIDLPRNVQLNTSTSYVGGVPAENIPSYVRLDIGVRWQPTESIDLGIWGRNLLDRQHPEFTTNTTSLLTYVPRGVMGKVTWSF